MMIDLGVTSGVKELWQENLLRDYTLVVEGQEFQVHKVVLAAVSKYFKAMLGEGYMESKTDRVEVKGFSADIVSKLLEFLYTADENVIGGDALGILQCAMYLQMPKIAEFCVKKLVQDINVQNCLDIVSTTIEYSFHKETNDAKDFIQRNWRNVIDEFNSNVMSYESLQVLVEFWEGSESEKFLFIDNWICVDYENRISFVNDLMSKVRFCIISEQELESVVQMDIFCNTGGPWRDLVVNAVNYHQSPIHLKVLDRSEQSKVKTEALPVFLTLDDSNGPEDFTVDFFALDDQKKWAKEEHNGFKSFALNGYLEIICLEINNFLIVCCSSDKIQDWQIFDPRTSSWSSMPNMKRAKWHFVMVHHNDILYTVGGKYLPKIDTREMEQYSFMTNSWNSVHQLPIPLFYTSACMLGDTLYVSGGCIGDGNRGLADLYCLDLASNDARWDTKAPLLRGVCHHQMCAMQQGGEEGLFVININFTMQFYSPANDLWSEIVNTLIPGYFKYQCIGAGGMFTKGNSVYILNLYLPKYAHKGKVCCELVIPESGGGAITKVDMDAFPRLLKQRNPSGAMLARPPQKVQP